MDHVSQAAQHGHRQRLDNVQPVVLLLHDLGAQQLCVHAASRQPCSLEPCDNCCLFGGIGAQFSKCNFLQQQQ